MHLEYALLADSADYVSGKLYLMGGDFDTVTPKEFPFRVLNLCLVAKFVTERDADKGAHNLRIEVVLPGEKLAPPMELPFDVSSAKSEKPKTNIQFVFGLHGLEFTEPGRCEFRIFVDDQLMKTVPLNVLAKGS